MIRTIRYYLFCALLLAVGTAAQGSTVDSYSLTGQLAISGFSMYEAPDESVKHPLNPDSNPLTMEFLWVISPSPDSTMTIGPTSSDLTGSATITAAGDLLDMPLDTWESLADVLRDGGATGSYTFPPGLNFNAGDGTGTLFTMVLQDPSISLNTILNVREVTFTGSSLTWEILEAPAPSSIPLSSIYNLADGLTGGGPDGSISATFDVQAMAVPLPGAILLFASSILGLLFVHRRPAQAT